MLGQPQGIAMLDRTLVVNTGHLSRSTTWLQRPRVVAKATLLAEGFLRVDQYSGPSEAPDDEVCHGAEIVLITRARKAPCEATSREFAVFTEAGSTLAGATIAHRIADTR